MGTKNKTTFSKRKRDNTSEGGAGTTREGHDYPWMSELGYLFLTDCYVEVVEKRSHENVLPKQTWIDASLVYASEESKAIMPEGCSTNNNDPCSFSDLTFHEGGDAEEECASSSRLHLLVPHGSRFNGTLADMGRNNDTSSNGGGNASPSSPASSTRRRKRSDAALMMGVALACQDQGHVSIENVRILFHEDPHCDLDAGRLRAYSSASSSSFVNGGGERRRRCALLITLAFPQLANHRSITCVPSKKPLPASTQLLLSLIRSDWDFLENEMAKAERGSFYNTGRRSKVVVRQNKDNDTIAPVHPCFFPPKLSLEELYMRIPRSSSLALDQYSAGQTKKLQSTAHTVLGLVDLPEEVLRHRIAPFLRAKSLDSLRCACAHMHQILQSVVPGMKLRLYQHQIKSLKWMRIREARQITESELCSATFWKGGMIHDGDMHRAITGGKSVLLSPNKSGGSENSGVRLDQYSGSQVLTNKNGVLDRKVARGGLLCDDPGLGKTITVLSLVLQTIGLSTDTKHNSESNGSGSKLTKEETIFQTYWKTEMTTDFRHPALYKLLNDLIRGSDNTIRVFERPIDPIRDGCPDYLEVIKHPICLRTIRRKVDANEYGENFGAFTSDVELCFRNAMEYNPDEHWLHIAARRFLQRFRSLVSQFKSNQVGSARKKFSNATAKPNSAVAALIEEECGEEMIDALVSSRSTLIVIPGVLMEHWQEQIEAHVDLSYFTDKIPLLYEYKRHGEPGLDDVVFKCTKLKNTHYPAVFFDKAGTKPLPSPEFLAMFKIVITTTQRFTNEWKGGSFEDEQRKGVGRLRYNHEEVVASPLLKVHWLRMIVDEGHSMGRGNSSCAIRFAAWITAERRWAVTGTPTRQTVSQNGLHNLLGLMRFLRNDFFTPRLDGDKVWQKLIARSWNDGHLASFFRLRSLMSLLMIRHTKLDIEELPAPRFRTTVLPMSFVEVTTYNTLVCAVQSNILITSMEAKVSGGQDSLLHRSQAVHARKALGNIRLACSGGTRVVPGLSQKIWTGFVEECERLQMPDDTKERLINYCHRAESEELSQCMCCGILLSTLLILPCGHLLCTECMDSKTTSCFVCERPFDVDDFQLLQPGMDYQWKWNLEEEKALMKARAMDHPPPAPPPLAPAHALAMPGNDALEQNNEGQAEGAQIQRPNNRGRRPKFGDGHKCEYSKASATGKCIHCLTEHNSCKLINSMSRCEVCYRRAEDCPKEESKSFYIVEKLLKIYEAQKLIDFNDNNDTTRPLKVIIFSQFRKILNFVGDRLLRRFGTACVAEYWGSFRSMELHKFTHEKDCFCMLLGKDGSEGLDLSFVTHIFFLEPVWDKSLENQVVARAWRMGAKGQVEVETLVAQSSVEEQMWNLERMLGFQGMENDLLEEEEKKQGGDIQGVLSVVECASASDYLRTKIHFLLKNLELIKQSRNIPLMKRESSAGDKRPISSVQAVPSPSSVSEQVVPKKRKTARVVRFDV